MAFFRRFLRHPVMGLLTICLLAVIVLSLFVSIIKSPDVGVLFSMFGTMWVISVFGFYTIWHAYTHKRR